MHACEKVQRGPAKSVRHYVSAIPLGVNGLIPVGINFLAAQAHLGNLPAKVSDAIKSAQNVALDKFRQAVGVLGDKAKGLLGLNNHPEYQGLVAPVQTFDLGAEHHRLWVVATSTGAQVLMASTPGPVKGNAALVSQLTSLAVNLKAAVKAANWTLATNLTSQIKAVLDTLAAAIQQNGKLKPSTNEPGMAVTWVTVGGKQVGKIGQVTNSSSTSQGARAVAKFRTVSVRNRAAQRAVCSWSGQLRESGGGRRQIDS